MTRGGQVGAPLQGQVVIVEDVITSGISIDRAVEIIRNQGAIPAAVVISLDRMERSAESNNSAVENISRRYDINVFSVATVYDLIGFVNNTPELSQYADPLQDYLDKYVVK